MPLTPDQIHSLKTLLIGGSGGVVGSLCTEWVKTKLKVGIESKHRRREDAAKQIKERLSRERNVVREQEKIWRVVGEDLRYAWLVNPHWASFVDGKPTLRGWEDRPLTENVSFDTYTTQPLSSSRVDHAKQRAEWIVVRERERDELVYWTTRPHGAEDAHLFQALPEEKRRGLLQARRKERA